MKRIIQFVTVVVLLATAANSTAQNILNIAFGKGNSIRYDLQKGVYSMQLNGVATVTNAAAVCKGAMVYDSRQALSRSHTSKLIKTPAGNALLYTVTSKYAHAEMQQLFFVYTGKNYCMMQAILPGKTAAANYMSVLEGVYTNQQLKGDNRALFMPYDNDMWQRYDAQELTKANFNSSELSAVYNNDSREGIVLGSLQQNVWKSAVHLQKAAAAAASNISLFAGFTDSLITHEAKAHGTVTATNGYCESPIFFVGKFDDWRNGMETFASLNRRYNPRVIFSWNKAVPMGWNSWGVMQTGLNYTKAKAVVDFFAYSCKVFRTADNTLYIDLDSYWDNMAHGGMDGNVSELKGFADYCKQKGFKPGIYWAPFVDWGKSPRKMEGSEYNYEDAWILQNGKVMDTDGGRALDPTHPGTQARVKYVLGKFKDWGYEMIKIDFLTHGSLENDRFYDKKVTTGMQAFAQGMKLVDSVLDGKMLVYAAISPNLATARFTHMRRIGCDAFATIDHSEYTLNSTGYGWWQSGIYDFIDADHVVFGSESNNQNRARLASSVITGTVITGDDFSSAGKWKQTAASLLQNKALLSLARKGKAFRPVEANTGNKAVNVFAQQIDGVNYIAIFNYGNQSQSFNLGLERAGIKAKKLRATELFGGESKQVTGSLQATVGAADAVIYRLESL